MTSDERCSVLLLAAVRRGMREWFSPAACGLEKHGARRVATANGMKLTGHFDLTAPATRAASAAHPRRPP